MTVEPGWATVALLAGTSLVAGFIDAIAGGGGLLTLPALLSAGLPPHLALGTNKGQSVFGSGTALLYFSRTPLLDRRRARQGAAFALLGAALGVALVSRAPARLLTPVVMALLVAVALLMAWPRAPRPAQTPRVRPAWLAAAVALCMGAYDGFFGPGTGTFLIMLYAGVFADPLDAASANAKVVNFASNLASVAVFGAAGLVVWRVALPMAVGQIVGGWLGAHVTLRRGQRLVRVAVIVVSLALVVSLAIRL